MVNLFPREVPRVLNLFLRELIEGPLKDFPKTNLRLHQRQGAGFCVEKQQESRKFV